MKLQLRTFIKGDETIKLFGKTGYWTMRKEDEDKLGFDFLADNTLQEASKELKARGFKMIIETLEAKTETIWSGIGWGEEKIKSYKKTHGYDYLSFRDDQGVYYNEWIETFFKETKEL